MCTWLHAYFRQVAAEVVSKSSNKNHQTWGPPFSRALCSNVGRPRSLRSLTNRGEEHVVEEEGEGDDEEDELPRVARLVEVRADSGSATGTPPPRRPL